MFGQYVTISHYSFFHTFSNALLTTHSELFKLGLLTASLNKQKLRKVQYYVYEEHFYVSLTFLC
jgi:hypothetical protein